MEQSKDIQIMGGTTQLREDHPLWQGYKIQLTESLQSQGFTSDVIEARLIVAYNRMHDIRNTPAQLKAANAGKSNIEEWKTGVAGDEIF